MSESSDARSRAKEVTHRPMEGWDLARHAPLPPEELTLCIHQYKATGEIECRNRVIESHLRLVAKNARRFSSSAAQFDDLMLEGTLAVIRALESFDHARGTSFTSYASCAVEHAVRDYARSSSGLMRLPSRERRKAAMQYRIEATFYAQHGRAPTAVEWAAADNGSATPQTSRSVIPHGREFSLDSPVGEESISSLIPADRQPMPADVLSSTEDSQHVARALESLAPAARESVRMRFGLGGQARLSLAEIGRRLHLSPHAVELMLADALRRLKRMMNSSPFLA